MVKVPIFNLTIDTVRQFSARRIEIAILSEFRGTSFSSNWEANTL
jgi:hypothetical protein